MNYKGLRRLENPPWYIHAGKKTKQHARIKLKQKSITIFPCSYFFDSYKQGKITPNTRLSRPLIMGSLFFIDIVDTYHLISRAFHLVPAGFHWLGTVQRLSSARKSNPKVLMAARVPSVEIPTRELLSSIPTDLLATASQLWGVEDLWWRRWGQWMLWPWRSVSENPSLWCS